MPRKSAARFIATIIFGFFICSCASIGTHRMYSGPLLPRSDVAILAKVDQDVLISTLILSVDGQEDCSTKIVELLPGRHTLRLAYGGVAGYSLSYLNYDFQAVAGRTYVVYGTNNIDTHDQEHPPQWQAHVDDITDKLSNPEWLKVKSAVEEYWTKQRASE